MNIWTLDYEMLLDKIRLNSIIMSNHHKNKYYKYNKKLKWFRLPIIIISAFNSVFSVSLQQFTSQENISLINCALSLIVGLLGSVELFLQIQKRCEIELKASKEFYLLSIDIYKMLKLDKNHRHVDGKTYLEDKYNEYCKLFENSGLVHKRILDQLQPIEKQLLKNSQSNTETNTSSHNDIENIDNIDNIDDIDNIDYIDNIDEIKDNIEIKNKSTLSNENISNNDIKNEYDLHNIELSEKINNLIINKKIKNIKNDNLDINV